MGHPSAVRFNVHDASCLRDGSYWQLGDEPLLDAAITFLNRHVVKEVVASPSRESARGDVVDGGAWAVIRRADDLLLLRVTSPRRDAFGRPGARRIAVFVVSRMDDLPVTWLGRVIAIVEAEGALDRAALERMRASGSAGSALPVSSGVVPSEVHRVSAALSIGEAAAWRVDARAGTASRVEIPRWDASRAGPEVGQAFAPGHHPPEPGRPQAAAVAPVAMRQGPLAMAALIGMAVGMVLMAWARGSSVSHGEPRLPSILLPPVQFDGGWLLLHREDVPFPEGTTPTSLGQVAADDPRAKLLDTVVDVWAKRPLRSGSVGEGRLPTDPPRGAQASPGAATSAPAPPPSGPDTEMPRR